MRTFIVIALVLFVFGCSHTYAGAPDPRLSRLVGQRVTLTGKFELAGKNGPYIHCSGAPVYLVPQGSFTWGADYERMQGKIVSITGKLQFRHFEHVTTDWSVAQPVDYFYFDAATAKVGLK